VTFQGSLAELRLADLLQLVAVSAKTGVFHLSEGAARGEVYLSEGHLVHATLGATVGEEAIYALAGWEKGEFRFDPGVVAPRRSVEKSNTFLLMEAAQRLDEWKLISQRIASADLIPEFVVDQKEDGQINLNTREWMILSKIDGRRSINTIAAECGMPAFDACRLLYGLVSTNLIRLRDPRGSRTR